MIAPTCKLKLKTPFYFIFCNFYVAATVSMPTKTSHNTNPTIVSITTLSGPFIANVFAKLMLERQTPPATYMVLAICQAWKQSRVKA